MFLIVSLVVSTLIYGKSLVTLDEDVTIQHLPTSYGNGVDYEDDIYDDFDDDHENYYEQRRRPSNGVSDKSVTLSDLTSGAPMMEDTQYKCLVPLPGRCVECPTANLTSDGTICNRDYPDNTQQSPCLQSLDDCCDFDVTGIDVNKRTCKYNSIIPAEELMCLYGDRDKYDRCYRCGANETSKRFGTMVCNHERDMYVCFDTPQECCDHIFPDNDTCMDRTVVPDILRERDCFEMGSNVYSLSNFDCIQACLDYVHRGDTNATLLREIRKYCPQTQIKILKQVQHDYYQPFVVSDIFSHWAHGYAVGDRGDQFNHKKSWAATPALCQAECQTYDWCIKFHHIIFVRYPNNPGTTYFVGDCWLKNLLEVRQAYKAIINDPLYNEAFCPVGMFTFCNKSAAKCKICDDKPRCIWNEEFLLAGWQLGGDDPDQCLVPVGPVPVVPKPFIDPDLTDDE